jgi:hypothetical protein
VIGSWRADATAWTAAPATDHDQTGELRPLERVLGQPLASNRIFRHAGKAQATDCPNGQSLSVSAIRHSRRK